MADLRARINQVMSDPTVTSFEAFKEQLAQKEVVVTERGKTLSYAFLDVHQKQRKARGQRLGQDFEKETILHELENRARRTTIEPDPSIANS